MIVTIFRCLISNSLQSLEALPQQPAGNYGVTTFTVISVEVVSPVSGVPFT